MPRLTGLNSALSISHITFRDCRVHIFSDNLSRKLYRACLQGERVALLLGFTLASWLKLALVYKQISKVGLPYHLGQLYQLC